MKNCALTIFCQQHFDSRVKDAVAKATAEAAIKSGVARILKNRGVFKGGRIRTMGITHSPAQRYDELTANYD